MKKLLILIIVLVALVGVGYVVLKNYYQPPQSATTSQTIPSDWKTYRDEEYGFEFKYPATWEIQESSTLKSTKGRDFLENGIILMTLNNPIPEIGYEAWKETEEKNIPISGSTKVFHKFIFTPLPSYPDYDSFILVTWNTEDWQRSGKIGIPKLQDNDFRISILNSVLSTFKFITP